MFMNLGSVAILMGRRDEGGLVRYSCMEASSSGKHSII